MKRSRLSYDEWKCIKSKKQSGKEVNTDSFEGYVGLIEIEDVSEKQIWRFNEQDITAMMNEKNEILLWYIDMIAGQGTDEDGVLFFDDLYLDLVVYPDGTIIVDDMDELEEALVMGDITQKQFELAISTSEKLKCGLLSDIKKFEEYTLKCFEWVK